MPTALSRFASRSVRRVAATCLVAAAAIACGPTRTPNWIELPAGYRGYLVVQFSDRSCPPLERRGEYEVIRFGEDGRACTSARYEDQEGIAND